MKNQVQANGGKCILRWPGVLKGANRKRCAGSLRVPRRIAYSVTLVTTGQTRAVMNKLVAASKRAFKRSALERDVAWRISIAGSIWEMSASHRTRASLALHGVGTGSPEDEIDLSTCSMAALREAVCGATDTYSDAQRALRIAQACLGAALELRAMPIPAVHTCAMATVNDVLGDALGGLARFDPLLPWMLAQTPQAIDRLRDCVLFAAAEGVFGMLFEAWENTFTKALHLLGFIRPARGHRVPVDQASTTLLKRALADIDLHVLTWTSAPRKLLLPMIAREAVLDDEGLRGPHEPWRKVRHDEIPETIRRSSLRRAA